MIHRFAIGQTDFGITTTASAGGTANVNISAGTTSVNSTAFTFSNSNGVSFGIDTNAVITATVATNYQSQGAYLTTAMASNRGSDFVQATANFFGTNASGTIGSNAISVSVAAPGAGGSMNISAGTTSSNVSAVTFKDSNGVSFGFDGSNVTATVQTNYLTTAMASNRGSDFVQATAAFHGTNASGTINSNNISVSVAAPSAASFNISAGTTSSNVTAVTFQDSNGVSFGFDGSNVTATVKTDYQSSGAYLTTAMASNRGSDFVQATAAFHGTNASGTINSNDISVSVAAQSVQSINVSAGTTSNNLTAFTLSNSNNVSFGLNGSTITATVTVASTQGSINVSAGTTSNLASAFTLSNSNNVSFGINASTITASIATTYAGTGFTTATTAGTNLVGTLNTSGLSLGVPAFLTTYVNDLTSARAGTNTSVVTTAGTDLSFAMDTSGATIAYPKWITAAAAAPITFSASNTSYALNTLAFSNSNGVSFGLGAGGNSSILTASVGAGGGVAISNSQTLFSTGTVALSEGGGAITIASSAGGQSLMFSVPQTSSLVGVNGISIVAAGSTISVSQNVQLSYFENMPILEPGSTTVSASGSVLQVVPFTLPDGISFDYFRFPVSMSYVSTEASGTTVNSTWTVNRSYTDVVAIMTQNFGASSLSLAYLTSGSATWVFQNQIGAAAQGSRYTVTQNVSYPISGTTSNYTTSYARSSANVQLSSASMTLFTGPHWLDVPMSASLSAGNYWLVIGRSTNSATQAGNSALGEASMWMSYIGASQNNLSVALMGAATNSSVQLQPGLGSWSTNAAVRSTSSMALASISAMASGPKAYFQMIRWA